MQDEYNAAIEEYKDWKKEGVELEENPYLINSPAWYAIKRNYEIALRKYSQETNKGVCYEDKCLSITLRSKNVDVLSCSKFTKVESGVFIYYKDSDGKKTLFDDFPNCCSAEGGTYKSFTNSKGRESCYCATSAPCAHGNVKEINPDGIVVFNVGEVNNSGGENNSANTTMVSSPECCVWYNYSYTINQDGDVQCVDPNTGKESLVSGDNRIEVIDDEISELEGLKLRIQSDLNKLKGSNPIYAG